MKSSGNSTVKSIIIMTTKLNEKRFDGVAYVTPSISSLDIKSEGVLCGSYIYHFGGGGTYGVGDINDNGEY